ncbi:LOW QUALITY PROTEIN: T-lymphocyte activation antigen CD86 [Eudromia elegans]
MEVCIFFLQSMILLPAHISCSFQKSPEIDIKDLTVFWLKGDGDVEVVHDVYYGQEVYKNLSPKYVNRTKMDVDRWTLQLLNVEIMDEGWCTCVVEHGEKASTKLIHKSVCSLRIIATYSRPEIAELHTGKLKPNEYLHLSYPSSRHYPEPRMVWLVSQKNTTCRHIRHMDVSQDADKLYNVASKLNITVPLNTLTNLSCLLHLGEHLGSLDSVPLGAADCFGIEETSACHLARQAPKPPRQPRGQLLHWPRSELRLPHALSLSISFLGITLRELTG